MLKIVNKCPRSLWMLSGDAVPSPRPYSNDHSLPRRADVVIIGGGITGCSTYYQLTKRGIKPVLLERHKITSGTTWHTGGLVWSLRPNDTDIQILDRTKQILKNLEKETGVEPGFINNGGIFIARTPVSL
ncbi:hypothetical protein GWI33_011779 [Rhynchophorus ferrugineus]|uniref:FAD dependent oxidoreductase domain-containing protein n=1 Tax=Rhynchophorus ferrugineus TaxID=354439 RepID=A0A834ICE9_RHYFE|nr:hypothetical protein GWI33_011779 [Rhynchophorus ferrugineus]